MSSAQQSSDGHLGDTEPKDLKEPKIKKSKKHKKDRKSSRKQAEILRDLPVVLGIQSCNESADDSAETAKDYVSKSKNGKGSRKEKKKDKENNKKESKKSREEKEKVEKDEMKGEKKKSRKRKHEDSVIQHESSTGSLNCEGHSDNSVLNPASLEENPDSDFDGLATKRDKSKKKKRKEIKRRKTTNQVSNLVVNELPKKATKKENQQNEQTKSDGSGQWSKVNLGSASRNDKFLKLMGAHKNKDNKKLLGRNLCMNKKENDAFNDQMASQFERARSMHFQKGFSQ